MTSRVSPFASLGPEPNATTLVVEDDRAVAGMLCYLLEEQGHPCEQARNAEEGWRAASAGTIGAAIIDIRLPGRDGWWLLARIRGAEGTPHMPVVMITGFLDGAIEEQARGLGCVWLGKPFTMDQLFAKLEEARALATAFKPS